MGQYISVLQDQISHLLTKVSIGINKRLAGLTTLVGSWFHISKLIETVGTECKYHYSAF